MTHDHVVIITCHLRSHGLASAAEEEQLAESHIQSREYQEVNLHTHITQEEIAEIMGMWWCHATEERTLLAVERGCEGAFFLWRM